ncbi:MULTISPECIES: hypothetical protein [unclassified Streptomyces]|uniref:hypothetical protein n=1 Tax=unclassified Streptomyces TaxID=2593676 RepID=UPI002DD7DA97|nr:MULTISPECIES: hypothetical protein [unclassified Streptomyces]WSA95575.1 hypothetical protein OIE63_31415 [Streptomyces sp. NBC_01795]WSB79991.1 hypothetical protein OHB04_32530 [Streptomyces sp. NBC_01775]WSS11801.1 hypothetical protein OG533_07680 [Streptomyces sp. NBC_01186]WSS40515.1 hypothetical protein OG220_07835 [Streptomyces sp. NBC_01187]
MDVEAALALATTAAASAAGGAATAAGQSAWESLLSLARRVTGRGAVGEGGAAGEARGAAGELTSVDPGDADQVRVLTGRLADQARADEEFAALLRGWAERHAPALHAERSEVHNTISGPAQVNGPVIQARDIHGGINPG